MNQTRVLLPTYHMLSQNSIWLDDCLKVTVFENSSEVSVSGEAMLDVSLKGIIYDETMIGLYDVSFNLLVG